MGDSPGRSGGGRFGALARISLVRNSLLMMATTAANLGLGFVFVLAATRTLDRAEFGLGSAIIAAMTLCGSIGSVGVGNALIQRLPGRTPGADWSRTLNAGLALGTAIALAVGLPAVVLLPIIDDEFDVVRVSVPAAMAFVAGIAILATSDIFDRAFVAERRTGSMLLRNVAISALKIILLALPWVNGHGAWGIAGAWIAAPLLITPLSLRLVGRLGRGYRPVVDGLAGESRAMARMLGGNQLVSIGNLAPQYLLPLLVTALVSAADNGTFVATWRVAGAAMVISAAIATNMFAEMSHDPARLRRTVRRGGTMIAGLLLPSIALFVVIGGPILGILGEDYRDGYALLVLLLVGSIPDAVTNVAVAVLRHERRYRFASVLTLGMAGLTVAISALLLPRIGIEAVGWAWIIAQTAGAALVAADVARRRRLHVAPA